MLLVLLQVMESLETAEVFHAKFFLRICLSLEFRNAQEKLRKCRKQILKMYLISAISIVFDLGKFAETFPNFCLSIFFIELVHVTLIFLSTLFAYVLLTKF